MKRLPILVLTALLFLSCPSPVDLFSDYWDINLISGYSLSSDWFRDYGLDDPGTEFEYLEYEEYTGSETTGLPSGAVPYRLNLINLFTNGNFEDNTDPLLPWTSKGSSILSYQEVDLVTDINTNDAASLGSGALKYTIDTTGEYFYSKLTKSDGTNQAFVSGMTYLLDFDIYHDQKSYLEIAEGTTTELKTSSNDTFEIEINATDAVIDNPEKKILSLSTLDTFLVIGSVEGGETQAGTQILDNIEIIRQDITPKLYLDIPFREDDRLDLVSGLYKFSVYLKADPDSGANSTENRRTATTATLQIDREVTGAQKLSTVTLTSEWVEYSVYFNAQIDIPPAGEEAETSLSLSIAPYNYFNTRTGSLLIASPSLEFVGEETL